MAKVRDYGREVLRTVPGLVLTGAQTAPHIISLSLPGLRSQGIINCLQDKEIYVSAGSACARGHRSHVLAAMGLLSEYYPQIALRIMKKELENDGYTEQEDSGR